MRVMVWKKWAAGKKARAKASLVKKNERIQDLEEQIEAG